MPTPLRSVRIPDDVWDAARAKADAEGISVSEVMVKALRRFITRPPRRGPSADV